ncbi:MAG: hypothetical protein ACUVTU_07335 [Desulfurispora sp.]|uniref:hypothetical protein n=1 Tax=Desulfurispora sp. TaxID=3014275 RepID=UPI00404993C3
MRQAGPEAVPEKARVRAANIWLLGAAVALAGILIYVILETLLLFTGQAAGAPELLFHPFGWQLLGRAGRHLDWLLRYVFLLVSFLPLLGAFLISRSRLLQAWGGILSLLLLTIWIWWG